MISSLRFFISSITSDANNDDVVGDEIEVEATHTQEKGEKRKREIKLSSRAWGHFSKLEVNEGKNQLAKCNYCGKSFTCSSRGGTTHLLRHIDNDLCTAYNKEGNPIRIKF